MQKPTAPNRYQWLNQTSEQMAQHWAGASPQRAGDREGKWFEGGVKEVVTVHLEHPSVIPHLPRVSRELVNIEGTQAVVARIV